MSKWLITVFLAVTASGVQAAGDVEAGRAIATTVCVACHGADGNGSPASAVWPKLAGQHATYLVKQLQDFREDKRSDPLMTTQAKILQEGDLENVAAYFSAQIQTGGVAAAAQVKLGETLFRAGNAATGVPACMACHGPDGAGNPPAGFPRISGQQAAYIEKALGDFQSGARQNDPQKMMQGAVKGMTKDEIAAVAQYAQGLH